MKEKFKSISLEWWEFHKCSIKINSLQMYQSKLKLINATFGNRSIKSISATDIQQFINELTTEKCLSKSTVSKYRYTLNMVFNYALKQGTINSNPVILTKLPKIMNKHCRRSLTEAEIMLVNKYAKKEFGLYAFFLLYTGLRRSECLALRWEDIDFKNNTIHIYKTVTFHRNQPIIDYQLKNGESERFIPLLKKLKHVLLQLRKSEGWIFCDDDNKLMTEWQYEGLWRRYKKETGFTLTQHYLRHTYATLLYNAGIDVKAAQAFLGHKTLSVTLDIYTHLDKKKLIEKAKLLDDYVSNNLDKT